MNYNICHQHEEIDEECKYWYNDIFKKIKLSNYYKKKKKYMNVGLNVFFRNIFVKKIFIILLVNTCKYL